MLCREWRELTAEAARTVRQQRELFSALREELDAGGTRRAALVAACGGSAASASRPGFGRGGGRTTPARGLGPGPGRAGGIPGRDRRARRRGGLGRVPQVRYSNQVKKGGC